MDKMYKAGGKVDKPPKNAVVDKANITPRKKPFGATLNSSDADQFNVDTEGNPRLKKKPKVKNMMGGGKVMYKAGGKVRGYGIARGAKACKMR